MMETPYRILVINGPNLQLLGTRRPDVYGDDTLSDVEALVERTATELQLEAVCRQSNHEGDLVDWIGSARGQFDGLVLNPGAYSHTSLAMRDAIEAVALPAIEVHISNIHARESFRHRSVISAVCLGQIAGLGIRGYAMAIRALGDHLRTHA